MTVQTQTQLNTMERIAKEHGMRSIIKGMEFCLVMPTSDKQIDVMVIVSSVKQLYNELGY